MPSYLIQTKNWKILKRIIIKLFRPHFLEKECGLFMIIKQTHRFNNTLNNGYIIGCEDLVESSEKCKKCIQNLGECEIVCWKKE